MSSDQKRIDEWIATFGKTEFDYLNPDDQEISPLKTMDIPLINRQESKKYGCFNIKRDETENKMGSHLIEHYIDDDIYCYINNKWKNVYSHRLYSWEHKIEHRDHIVEYRDEPLIPVIYVDIELLVFYIESEDGTLICTPDKRNWYRYRIKPEKRPYIERIPYLVKFKIPNC